MTKSWLFFLSIPFAAFALAFLAGAIMLRFLLKHARVSLSETRAGISTHVETPFLALDMRPEEQMDTRLAKIPVYPGALRENPMLADTVSEIGFGSRSFREISASYWTPDGEKRVWEFYRQQLPGWNRNLDEVQGGKELIHDARDCVLLVRVSKNCERTMIETCVKPAGYPHLFDRKI